MNKMLIALIYYVNTYPFNKIIYKELPNEFSIVTCNYSLYYFIDSILNKVIIPEDSQCILATTFIIINKLIMKGIRLDIYNQHNLFAICLMISLKLLDDLHYNNEVWSNIINISLKKLNMMEKTILDILNYDLYISKELFDVTLKILMYVPLQQAIYEIDCAYKKIKSEI